MLGAGQSREANKSEFVERLVKNGWDREDAELEYEIQVSEPCEEEAL